MRLPRSAGLFCVWLPVFLLLCVSCGGGGEPVTPPDGEEPELIGSLKTVCAEDLALNGTILYLADGPGGLKVIDIADPSKPSLVRTVQTTYAFRVYIYSGHLYVCDASGGLKVFSLAAPSNPTQTFSEATNWASSAAFHQGYLFLGDYYGGVRIYNVANPAAPAYIKTAQNTRARDTAFDSDTLLVADNPYGLSTFFLSGPANPVNTFTDSGRIGNYEDIIGHAGFGIIARNDDSSRIGIYSIANLSAVGLASELLPARFIEGLSADGDKLFASCGEDGVIGYDMGDLPALEKLWQVNTPGYARRARLSGDILYVADMAGIAVYDLHTKGGD